MQFASTLQKAAGVTIGAAIATWGTGAIAATFSPEPLFNTVASFSTTIDTATGMDAADIYYPVISDPNADLLPIALLLQGALVDKSEYANFASSIASYGFGVIVPNRERTLIGPMGPISGFFPEQEQLHDVLAFASAPNSPVARLFDPNTLVLLGHSFGGAVGLNAIQETCFFPFCTGSFTRPAALMGGIFYGTDLRIADGVPIPPIDNAGIPLGLVRGTNDGRANPADALATYEQIQDLPRALVTVLGANHFGITNTNNPIGAIPDPIAPTLPQPVATETIARWSALFLRATVLGDEGAFDYVFNTGDALDENVSVISEARAVPEPSLGVGMLGFGAIGITMQVSRKRSGRTEKTRESA